MEMYTPYVYMNMVLFYKKFMLAGFGRAPAGFDRAPAGSGRAPAGSGRALVVLCHLVLQKNQCVLLHNAVILFFFYFRGSFRLTDFI